MADQRAWWTFTISHEPHGPHDSTIELSAADIEHIAEFIGRGFTEGEIVQDDDGSPHTLVWESAGTDEPGDQHADSARQVAENATSAYYSLGPCLLYPDGTEEVWEVELVQVRHGCEIGTTSLGAHPDEAAAKEAAQRHENQTLAPHTA